MQNIIQYSYSNINPGINLVATACRSGRCNEVMGLEWLFLVPFLIALIFISVLMLVSIWKIFTKAGQSGWKSIVPIYNLIISMRIIKRPVWFIILMLLPYISLVISVITSHDLAVSFGKGKLFTLGLIFLPFIFYPILAFGESKYTAPNR